MKKAKLKVRPDKASGQTFKAFEVEVRELNLQERAELNDKIMDKEVKQNFSFWLSIIKDCTDYSDEELNEYSLEELVQMSSVIIENANKKKLKK
ncbi:MAG: hypothetical protein Unbinned1524contig1003_7 [Prokaryotic dsDNA virus sp.]|nr:MAG: hypothetical protein Unbinned1524contig1003_7 [Prokaryotic dsDNA virus sp.]|tara:strand:- start:10758 stop:11039 length:282 start_codon:yes stop_codon:yes gene_type:complete